MTTMTPIATLGRENRKGLAGLVRWALLLGLCALTLGGCGTDWPESIEQATTQDADTPYPLLRPIEGN